EEEEEARTNSREAAENMEEGDVDEETMTVKELQRTARSVVVALLWTLITGFLVLVTVPYVPSALLFVWLGIILLLLYMNFLVLWELRSRAGRRPEAMDI
ncbi:hypothetical protein GOP47_0018173, partial [Adiantum capillus-veneris]